jgi:hypothetical protein
LIVVRPVAIRIAPVCVFDCRVDRLGDCFAGIATGDSARGGTDNNTNRTCDCAGRSACGGSASGCADTHTDRVCSGFIGDWIAVQVAIICVRIG